MLVVKACHISTQAATIRCRWPRDSSSRKKAARGACARWGASTRRPRRPRLARQAHSILESLAEWGFARQLRDALDLDPAVGTAHAIDLHDHRGPILAPRQIPHLALADVVHLAHAC